MRTKVIASVGLTPNSIVFIKRVSAKDAANPIATPIAVKVIP